MSADGPRTRTIRTDYLARVEGEGAMYVHLRGDEVADVRLRIYEPPRFFEAFLRGRSFLEAPDITARICGICPVAYQLSACHAIEDACGVEVGGHFQHRRRQVEGAAGGQRVAQLGKPALVGNDRQLGPELARQARELASLAPGRQGDDTPFVAIAADQVERRRADRAGRVGGDRRGEGAPQEPLARCAARAAAGSPNC